MNLIICLDNGGGYSFAGRRQSSDKIQFADMLSMVGDNNLYLTEYSAKLLENIPQNVIVSEDPINTAEENDFCFVENIDVGCPDINKLIIYRWNRAYPSDKKLPPELIYGKELVEAFEFAGNSHERITREVYR